MTRSSNTAAIVFFRELNENYIRLQADPKAWEEELAERQLWDAANTDGLDRE